MYPSRYHARTTLTGGKIPLGRRSETPVRECPIAYLALIAIRTMLPFICGLPWNCLVCLPLLLLTALYVYLACSPPAPLTALSLVSLILFYLPASNIALNLILEYTKP